MGQKYATQRGGPRSSPVPTLPKYYTPITFEKKIVLLYQQIGNIIMSVALSVKLFLYQQVDKQKKKRGKTVRLITVLSLIYPIALTQRDPDS